ncbi:MAG: ice-binding family protein [Bacillota bacterium]|nr:ice-binding family protein [Bacillota bacterium]
MKKSNRFLSLTMVLLLMITMIGPTVSMAAETTLDFGTAESFAILAGSTITNTGTTTITGDVGLHPGTIFSGQDTATVIGEIHIADAVALQAKNDLTSAFNDAAGRTINTTEAELGGRTLAPGVYSSATSFQITGTLTLDGQNNADSVFIFQTGSTLTTASASKIELINGANYNNIFWQVGSSATLGTNSEFEGTILAAQSITATTGADIRGKLFAMSGAVTLDNNTIINAMTTSITVKKIVTGDTAGIALPVFTISVTGPDNFSESKAFVHDESFTWDELVPGTYTVTESRTTLNDDWTVSGEGAIEVLADQVNLATITNAYAVEPTPTEPTPTEPTPVTPTPVSTLKGSLTVGKLVTGNITGMTLPKFNITVTGPEGFDVTRTIANNTTYTWVNLEPGDYTVTESRTTLDTDWTVSGEGTITVVSEQTAVATITNLYEGTVTAPVTPIAPPVPTEPTTPVPTEPTPVPTPEPTPVPSIPQTGQSTDYGMAMVLGITALLLAGAGVISASRRKRFNA